MTEDPCEKLGGCPTSSICDDSNRCVIAELIAKGFTVQQANAAPTEKIERNNEIRRLYQAGQPIVVIAAKFGLSYSRARAICVRDMR